MTPQDHRTRLRRLGSTRRAAQAAQRTVPPAAREAHAAGLPIAEIATLLGMTRMQAHRLVHGRSDR